MQKPTKKKESTANRGMDFEKKINKKCDEYFKNGIACIFKVPTDWVVIRNGAKIISAYPREKSIIDYLGSYNGEGIGIEAKRTTNETSFSFNNVKEHQWNFFKTWCQHAKGYFLIWFKTQDKYFLVKAEKLQKAKDTLGRKSAPFDWFLDENNAISIDKDLDFIKYIN